MFTSTRKRNRQRKACLACRRRKSKCDCRRPVCDTCKRRQTEHICIFDDLYPFQRSLRLQQPEAVDPNFPSFLPIHLPQLIAIGNRVPDTRQYSQNLYEFQKGSISPPCNKSPTTGTNKTPPQHDDRDSANSLGVHAEENSDAKKVEDPSGKTFEQMKTIESNSSS